MAPGANPSGPLDKDFSRTTGRPELHMARVFLYLILDILHITQEEAMTTTTKPLSVEEVRALLVRAVEEKGADYVYVNPDGVVADGSTSCFNFDPATFLPSCIVGHVLHYAGADFAADEVDVHATAGEACLDWMVDDARRGLSRAQEVQDGGGAWEEALEAFDLYVARASA